MAEVVAQTSAALALDGMAVIAAPAGNHRPSVVWASDERLAVLEDHEAADQDGPCHEALRTGAPVWSDDLLFESRWPSYRALALVHGTRAVACVPLPGPTAAAVVLHRGEPGAWEDLLQSAQPVVEVASTLLTSDGDHAEPPTAAV